MVNGVYEPYIFVKKTDLRSKQTNEMIMSDGDQRIFNVFDHLMGSHRQWTGIGGRFASNNGSGQMLGIGSAGMAPEELRIRKFMESCTFKAMISCAGGEEKIFNDEDEFIE
jgi:hypothetical protein